MAGAERPRNVRLLLGFAFTAAGVAHVVKHEWFERLVPESLSQWRKSISAATAAIQIVGGTAMFVPRLRVLARWTNLALLVSTLPAAVAQIDHPDVLRRAGIVPALAPVRVVVQVVLAGLTWWATRPTRPRDHRP